MPPALPYAVSATSHWPNYLPEYVAADLGFFADEGLEFRRWAPEDWTRVLGDLDSGEADAVLGGLWVPAMYHGRGREHRAFAVLNARNPKAFVMRSPAPGFTVADLAGRTVLAPGAGSAAYYIHTAGLLRRAGVDPTEVTFIRDLSAGILTELFLGGAGDVLITDVFNAVALERAGKAHIVLRVDALGLMPNSVYYTTPDRLDDAERRPYRFARALARGMRWLLEHPAREVEPLLRRQWPGLDPGLLVDVVDDLRTSGLWADIRCDRAGFEEWMAMQAESVLTDGPVSYETLIDPGPAQEAAEAVGWAAPTTATVPASGGTR
jgi:NitT/TauT family transport system substrate-binding protein